MTCPPTGPRRRSVVIGAVCSVALAGCSSSSAAPRPPSVDQLAALRAARTIETLLTGLALFSVRSATLGSLITEVISDHRAQLAALGVPAPAAPSAPSTISPTASPTTRSADPADAVAAQRRAAEQALADVAITSPLTAGLLARLAAAQAVHADLLASVARLPAPAPLTATVPPATSASPGPSTAVPASPGPSTATSDGSVAPTSTSASAAAPPTAASSGAGAAPAAGATISALSALLAGEHAAVFAYGLIAARIDASRQAQARALWQAHRVRRDALQQELAAAGATPPAASPAYDVGALPTTPDEVTRLAARVEDGLAAVALRAVATTEGPVRLEAATDLILAARRAASWSGTPQALPG